MCLAKPAELVTLYDEAPEAFGLIREQFGVPDRHTLDVASVDRAPSELGEVAMTAALTLHYVQSLRLLAKPSRRVRITSIVNTSACLHSLLSGLAAECDARSSAHRLLQVRDKIGMAAAAVAALDLAHGGDNKFMQ